MRFKIDCSTTDHFWENYEKGELLYQELTSDSSSVQKSSPTTMM